MDPLSVTVISCLYGSTHDRFLPEWVEAVTALEPAPHEVVLAHSTSQFVPEVYAVQHRMNGGWRYPQAYYLTKALGHVTTDWVWIHDVDDLAFVDALGGIEEGDADVYQMGYLRSDGEIYLPPAGTSDWTKNPFVSSSMVRTSWLRKVGGFPDCALQDWALWHALSRAGAKWAASDRPRFHYRRHPQARGEMELTLLERARHMAEMEDCLALA